MKILFSQVGQHYHSKACGLCGNLDSNPSNDLEGPQKTQYPDGSTVSAAYLVPDEQCQAEEIQQKMRVPHIRNQASEFHIFYYRVSMSICDMI